jgi:hypothetical protein
MAVDFSILWDKLTFICEKNVRFAFVRNFFLNLYLVFLLDFPFSGSFDRDILASPLSCLLLYEGVIIPSCLVSRSFLCSPLSAHRRVSSVSFFLALSPFPFDWLLFRVKTRDEFFRGSVMWWFWDWLLRFGMAGLLSWGVKCLKEMISYYYLRVKERDLLLVHPPAERDSSDVCCILDSVLFWECSPAEDSENKLVNWLWSKWNQLA